MYIYESHMGGFFTKDEILSYEEEYCEQCGDSDNFIGYADSRKTAWKLLKPMTDINDSGGYDRNYVDDFINNNFEE